MAKEREHDRLNACIEGVISSGEFAPSGDEDVDALARLAAGLRGLPDPQFKARLKAELLPERAAPAWWPAGIPARAAGIRLEGAATWLRRNRPFVAAGGGYGLLAGTCCLTGALAHGLGLASAATVSAFIHTALPYFVALSIVGLAAWLLLRVVREQGLTPATFWATVKRHGFALGGAYGATFGATMGLVVAMGLV